MKYLIVYSSETGNTKLLAETVHKELPENDCVYFGLSNVISDNDIQKAQRVYVGFWTDKGSCDSNTAAFLKKLTKQEVFLFGSAGFGGSDEYFNQIVDKVKENIPSTAKVLGSFMCQGKMQMSVREHYEKMLINPNQKGNVQMLIDNFDKALTHPDENDLNNLKSALKNL